jgi:hypothetical protein
VIDRSSFVVANAVRAKEPKLADLLVAQYTSDAPQILSLLAASDRSRDNFSLIASGLFADYVTVLEEFLWFYDDDIVGLVDGGIAPAKANDPWDYNTKAIEALELLWPRIGWSIESIRLCLFEGTERTTRALYGMLDAMDRVTHLELRQQSAKTIVPLEFPNLRGLACHGSHVNELLSNGAPTLESLVLWGENGFCSLPSVEIPQLRHLGLFHVTPSSDSLSALLEHPLIARLESLEFSDINRSNQFPFDALRGRAGGPRITVAGHLVPQAIRDGLPEVEFVTWDRRERLAHDFAAQGWGAHAR